MIPENFRVANTLTVSGGNVVISTGQLVIGETVINANSISDTANTAYTNATSFAANADNISTGIVDAERLGTGTANTSTWLRGDGSWQEGPLGYTGSQGTTGYAGSQGDTGYTGSFGADGYTGSQGIQGIQGYTGSEGLQGDTGYTGSQGPQGINGYTGSQGPQGVIGYTGSQGSQGVVGYTGSQGTQGNIGYTGSQGIQGINGYTGSQGTQGVIGYTGSAGPAGGSNTQIQFNDSGVANGATNFTFNKSTNATTLPGTLATGNTTVTGFANVSSTLQVGGAATFNANVTLGTANHLILSSTSGISANGTLGTSGQALLSGGAGANPTWGSVFPSQTGNAGKFLQTDGSTTSWANAGGSVGDITYSTQAPTASWIACNGAIYLKATYPDLATKLGQLSNPYNMVFTSANRSGYYLDGIAKIGSTWYLSAYQYGTNNSFALYSSSDLSTWTTLISPSASQLGYPIVVPSLSRLVFHQPKSVAYANSPYTSTTTSTISGQATDWYGFYDYSGTNGGMAFDGNTTFVVAGSRRPFSDTDYARIAVSTNSGASFATISTPISGFGNAGTYCSGCVYGAGKFVVCGNISGANNCEIMYSTNGSSWTKVVLPNGSGSTTGDIVFVGNKFWVSSSSVNKLWTSADAITWTEYTTKPTGIGTVSTFHMSEVPSLNLIFWMASGSLTSTYYYSLDGGATWITNTISYATNPAMLFEKWNRSTVGGYIWPRFTSNGTYTVLYTAGYDYNPSTQFKVPTFSSLSTLSGTYTAPVTAFIKAI